MNGLQLVQRIYRRLRMPSQQMLPYKVVLESVHEVIARKKLDLSLSEQNALAITSPWFTPSSADFDLEDLGLSVLLPIRIERKALDSEFETGEQVPIVNYEILDTSIVGAVSFYGDPLRMVFRDKLDYITQQQYRIIYESDFDETTSLAKVTGLPEFFAGMVVLEAAYELIELIDDTSPEWLNFVKMTSGRWETQIAINVTSWEKYVRKFKGRAQVPKRTYFQNRRDRIPTRFFKG